MQLALPAGSTLRFTVTARPDIGEHRWGVSLFETPDPPEGARLLQRYESHIGGLDCDQRIEAPTQDVDCRVEVGCARIDGLEWRDDLSTVSSNTPRQMVVGFSDARLPDQSGQVVFSFAFAGAPRTV